MTTISVVIPTRNRIDILRNALRHLDNGSAIPDEVIIVDDASNPSVQSQIKLNQYRFPIKFIRFDINRGASCARNAGIRIAKKQLLLLMDDDIWPDHNMIYYHKIIHQQNPQTGYGVSGRVIFDPELQRTTLLHYLEEYGFYRWLAKLRERELFSTGILTANISFKREFLNDIDLFDEDFPYNRNEDTEFGLRLMNRGFEPRFHSAPSAIHHSPLTFESYNNILMQSGYSKAYWSNKKPDDTFFCLYLSKFLRRAEQNAIFQKMYDNFIDNLGEEFFLCDISECPFDIFEEFRLFMPIAEDWIQTLNIVSAWKSSIPGFENMSAEIKRSFNCRTKNDAIKFIRKGFHKNTNFFPAAVLLADELKSQKKYNEARQILNVFKDSIWAMLKIGEIDYYTQNYWKSFNMFLNAYAQASHGKAVEDKQREIATEWIHKILPKIGYSPKSLFGILKQSNTSDIELNHKIMNKLKSRDVTAPYSVHQQNSVEMSTRINELKKIRGKIDSLNKVISIQTVYSSQIKRYILIYRRLKSAIEKISYYLSVKRHFRSL